MRDKIKVLIITSIICLFYCGVAFGYTGGGTKGNPYIVSNVSIFPPNPNITYEVFNILKQYPGLL